MDFNQVSLKSPEPSFVYMLNMCICIKNKFYDASSWVVLKRHCQDIPEVRVILEDCMRRHLCVGRTDRNCYQEPQRA